VQRVTTQDNASQTENWRIRLRAPEAVRIEARLPQVRVLVATDSVVEYLPEVKQALKTRFKGPESKQEFLKKILGHVAITGSRFGSPQELLKRYHFEGVQKASGVRLLGTPVDPRNGTLVLELSAQGMTRGELYDARNRLVIRQTAGDFQTFGDITLPLRTVTEIYQPKRSTVEIRLSGVTINRPIPEELFELPLPPGTLIQEQVL
jgi:hypothetical protein